MIADSDVVELYRCLLGRAPEAPGTVTAFQTYYADFAQGRLAVLGSDEFSHLLNRQTGRVAAELTRRFLQRAGGVAQPAAAQAPPGLAGAMRMMLRAHGAVRLAVVVGQGRSSGQGGLAGVADSGLGDLLPLENAQGAVLHVSDQFPAFIPQTAELPGGGTLFRVSFDAAGLASFLTQAGLSIDLLALLGGDPSWWDALRPCLSDRAILAAAADIVFPDWDDLEAPVHMTGISVRHRNGWFLPVAYRPPPAMDGPALEGGAPQIALPGLCVAAIVRNEEAAVVNMLESAADVAGSFVVLDTGSSDDTFARAEACLVATGKPFTIARAEPGRFDTMRNAALDLVPASAEWVLMLDADEELCAEDRAALRALLPHAEHDAYALPRYNYQGIDKSGFVAPYPDRQVRLLRIGPDHHPAYEGAVHETVRGVAVCRLPLDGSALGHDRGGPHIHHLVRRFRSPDAEAAKQVYYRQIAQAQLDQAQLDKAQVERAQVQKAQLEQAQLEQETAGLTQLADAAAAPDLLPCAELLQPA
jgi:hypothetical protein